jgi:oligogalacturonide lyase
MYLAQAFVDETPEKRFRIRESETSWHYNIARDGKTLCGDGEGRYFRLSPSARWIYKYEPDGKRMMVTKLANMKRHSYKIPTNAHITPDGRWVVFQSDLYGGPHVYAVAAE